MTSTTLTRSETLILPRAMGRAPRSLWGDAWRRFRRNRLAVAGLVYLGLLLAVAVAAPALAPHNPVQSDVARAGTFRRAAWQDTVNQKRTGSWDYPLGTDAIGRDVLSRLLYGTRVSLMVGVVPTIAILVIGVPIGLVAGYLGGRVDNLLMRFTDVVYAFPVLLFFLTMQMALRHTTLGTMLNGLALLFLTLSVVSWTGIARLVRGQVLAIKEREFIEAAQVSGASGWRIVSRHVFPNTLGTIVVAGAFIVPFAIVAEIVLSYLGIGIHADVRLDAPFPTSWGYMLLEGYKAWQSQPWMLVAPCAAVGAITLACTFVGDGLRDALDPRDSHW